MVRPEIVTVLPEAIWKRRLLALPSIARTSAPAPLMVTLLTTSNCPVVSVMAPEILVALMVSPSAALASACRSEPAPLSFVFVTVRVVACAEFATAPSSTIAMVAGRMANMPTDSEKSAPEATTLP